MLIDLELEDLLSLRASKNHQVQSYLQLINWGFGLSQWKKEGKLGNALSELVYAARRSGGVAVKRGSLYPNCQKCGKMFPRDGVILYSMALPKAPYAEVKLCVECFDRVKIAFSHIFSRFEDEMEVASELLQGYPSKLYRNAKFICRKCHSKTTENNLKVSISPYYKPHILRCPKCRSHEISMLPQFYLRPRQNYFVVR
ncbi:MAG: hypothetical protein WDA42_00800 [Candidatus Bathyarchaeia archaeon]